MVSRDSGNYRNTRRSRHQDHCMPSSSRGAEQISRSGCCCPSFRYRIHHYDNQPVRDMRDMVRKRCDNGFVSLFLAQVDQWLRSCEEYVRRSSGKRFANDILEGSRMHIRRSSWWSQPLISPTKPTAPIIISQVPFVQDKSSISAGISGPSSQDSNRGVATIGLLNWISAQDLKGFRS